MLFIILGTVAFLLFFLYDINSILKKSRLLNGCFFAGLLLLIAATAGIILTSREALKLEMIRTGICGFLTVLFFGLLIYTLFFALPFKDTYLNTEAEPKVYREGMYALCRHPGVLWFIGMYISLGQALQLPMLNLAAVIFSSLNILYVIFQDKWTFMRAFPDYKDYKNETPFLIPGLHSMRRCFKTISR